MIIDIHGHYTTEPPALHAFRDRQLAGLADASRRPGPYKSVADLGISDELLRWTPGGYTDRMPRRRALVITPPSLITVLRQGWEGAVPLLHPSILEG